MIATGSQWRREGVARYHRSPITDLDQTAVFTPDDIMDSRAIEGPVLVYDDDQLGTWPSQAPS